MIVQLRPNSSVLRAAVRSNSDELFLPHRMSFEGHVYLFLQRHLGRVGTMVRSQADVAIVTIAMLLHVMRGTSGGQTDPAVVGPFW